MTIPWLFEAAGAPNARVAATPAIVPPVIARKDRRSYRDVMSSGPCQRPCRRGSLTTILFRTPTECDALRNSASETPPTALFDPKHDEPRRREACQHY